MIERRHFPRLHANVLCRSAGLGGPRRAAIDASEGGLRMYSDDAVIVGTRLELELLGADQVAVELLARVVRVEPLPPPSPARYDVAVEFLSVPWDARQELIRLGVIPAPASPSQPRIEEHQAEHVERVEEKHSGDGLLQAARGVAVAGGPHRNGDVREKDRNEEGLLHSVPRRDARTGPRLERRVGPRKVLFVTPYLPSPPRFGGQQRMHALISGLSGSHEVSVLSLVDPHESQAEAVRATRDYCRQVTCVDNHRVPASAAAKRLLQLESLVSPRSYEAMVHREPALETALEQLLSLHRFDVVHFEFPSMASFAVERGRTKAAPLFLLDEHNIEHDLARQTVESGRSPLRRMYSAIDGAKVRAEEKRVWASVDGCTVASEDDERLLRAECPGARTAVIPNGVDLDFYRPSPEAPARGSREARQSPMILFFGAIDYHPNTDGLLWFLREVWPLLSAENPGATLCIVGRRPPPSILAFRSRSVEIAGMVPDLRPYLARASAVIVPLRMGGGTRLKILEAMAMGKGIVSTTVGAQGLAVADGRELLIADDAPTFSAKVGALIDGPELAGRLGAAGRRFVTAHHAWRASVDRLASFYAQLLGERAFAVLRGESA